MLTFQQIGDEAASQLQDTSSATRTLIDRAVNQGAQKFAAVLNREVRVKRRTFSTQNGVRILQLPEDCIRPKNIVITVGGNDYPLEEVSDDEEWNRLVASDNSTSASPRYFHCEGMDEFAIWPTPADIYTGTIRYEQRLPRLSASDYATGTVAVTNGSQAVVGTGTTWTSTMVGRTLVVEDASNEDGIAYKITAFTDATHITIENYYDGQTNGSASYRIGQVPDIPAEYHEALIDYALYRGYRKRRDRSASNDSITAFKDQLTECETVYSSSTSSQYVRAGRRGTMAGYRRDNRDLKVV